MGASVLVHTLDAQDPWDTAAECWPCPFLACGGDEPRGVLSGQMRCYRLIDSSTVRLYHDNRSIVGQGGLVGPTRSSDRLYHRGIRDRPL